MGRKTPRRIDLTIVALPSAPCRVCQETFANTRPAQWRYAWSVALTLSVEGEPPEHPGQGRFADRSSPDAGPLFRAATDIIAASPDAFPIRHGVGVVVTSRRSLPTRIGYGPWTR